MDLQDHGPAKFWSLEWLTFCLLFGAGTAALFLGRARFAEWGALELLAAAICGVVRTVKHLSLSGPGK